LTQFSPKATDVAKITHAGHYASPGHSWSPILGPSEAVCDFLLVNNINLHPFSHRRSNFDFHRKSLSLTPSFGLIP